MNPKVSIVVPAYNEAALLPMTLQSIREAIATLDEPAEIIVVDDDSTDATAEVARAGGAVVVPVKCRQISRVRNSGAAAARGEWLIFVDADTQITPEAVQATVRALRNGAAGGGCRVKFDGYVPFYARRILLPVFTRLYFWFKLAAGCYLYCTRAAFEQAGRFDERMYAGEEAALSRALGRVGRFVLLDEMVTTSGRKLRTYSMLEMMWILLRLAIGGQRGAMRKERSVMQVWYGPRRDDPSAGE
ncbi:MAG: Undecaprenyl-phosphate 4-deoxy-4-formamido-L-arabinose transferase [Phycisphaerae bacterium]|nr:Undecaprenyl-phosphate 4-deoxy-4-formamido-L-arabinose transferase [Phycisphaerae bacterium]